MSHSRVIRLLGAGIGAGASVVSAAVTACATYLTIITASAAVESRRRRDRPTPPRSDTCRFVVLVPAHNEAAIVDRSIKALLDLDYPQDRMTVHVVADNCTDATADIVAELGVAVHERSDAENPGKGPALNWLFDRVDSDHDFDAVVIIDADTVVESDFLTEMDRARRRGTVVAQGRYDVIEPGGSAAAGIRSAALASRHHVRPMGRNGLGGSSGLFGNGMMFDRSVLRDRRWSGHLVEDAELQNELLIDGLLVDYVAGARVRAEMPDTLDASVTQNERWELGRLQVARRFVPPLIALVARGDRRLRTARLDAVADHLVPPLSVLVAANGLGGALGLLAMLVRGSPGNRRAVLRSVVSLGAVIAHVLVALRMAGAPRAAYRALAAAPRAVVWKVVLWLRVLVRRNSVAWVRTQRNQQSVS